MRARESRRREARARPKVYRWPRPLSSLVMKVTAVFHGPPFYSVVFHEKNKGSKVWFAMALMKKVQKNVLKHHCFALGALL